MTPPRGCVAARRGLLLAAFVSVVGWLVWTYVWHDADGCPRFPPGRAGRCIHEVLIARYPDDPVAARAMIGRLGTGIARDSAWLHIASWIDNCPQYCNRIESADFRAHCLERAEYGTIFRKPGCWALPAGAARLPGQ